MDRATRRKLDKEMKPLKEKLIQLYLTQKDNLLDARISG